MQRTPWRWGESECDLLSVLALAGAALLLVGSSGTAVPRRVTPPLVLDPNAAPELALNALPRIGPTAAARIVAERARRPFRRVDDLDRVRGLGPSTIAAIRPYLRIAGPGPFP